MGGEGGGDRFEAAEDCPGRGREKKKKKRRSKSKKNKKRGCQVRELVKVGEAKERSGRGGGGNKK